MYTDIHYYGGRKFWVCPHCGEERELARLRDSTKWTCLGCLVDSKNQGNCVIVDGDTAQCVCKKCIDHPKAYTRNFRTMPNSSTDSDNSMCVHLRS